MVAAYKKLKKYVELVNEIGIEEAAYELGIQVESLKRAIRAYKQSDKPGQKKKQEPKQKNKKSFFSCITKRPKKSNKPVLCFSDTHAPYHHKDTLPFLQWVQKTRGCREEVVCAGDLFDFHSMSRFVSETDAPSPEEEYSNALQFAADLTKAFPRGQLVLGNHDLIVQRQLSSIGITTDVLRDQHSLYGLPESWGIHPLYYVLEPWNVLVEHGIGSMGKYGCANTAIQKRCSYVQGHNHSAAAVIYHQNHDSVIFGVNSGCLVDSTSLAMRYGKYGLRKGVIGCAVVYSEEHAEFIPISTYYAAVGKKYKL